MARNEVAVLGVGMHPWGKWGRPFVEYGVHAIKAALADSGLGWKDVQFIAGGDTMRTVHGTTEPCFKATVTDPRGEDPGETRELCGSAGVYRYVLEMACPETP